MMPQEFADRIERLLLVSAMEADRAFEHAGATGTKTWLREYFLPSLERNGLAVCMKDHVDALNASFLAKCEAKS